MPDQMLLWIGFNLFVLLLLALDLGVFHRQAHVVRTKEALLWSAVWIAMALLFNLGLSFWQGPKVALEFLTGDLIEKSLSVDNIFVFIMIFACFGMPALYQHKVLFWGILGALVMRAIFIASGVALLERFHWIIHVLGAFLMLTGVKMAWKKDREIHPEKNSVLRLFRRLKPVTDRHHGGAFFVKQAGRSFATPLVVVLLLVETTDLIFAVDSIPAILAITLDPFIFYTSNVFAILGLHSLYFALAGIMPLFHYLNYGLAAILAFVGAKMMLVKFYKIPIGISLGVVAVVLLISVLASLRWPRPQAPVTLPPVVPQPKPETIASTE